MAEFKKGIEVLYFSSYAENNKLFISVKTFTGFCIFLLSVNFLLKTPLDFTATILVQLLRHQHQKKLLF